MKDRAALTLLIGPQTLLGHALNDCSRVACRMTLSDGLVALPNRIAARQIRHILQSSDGLGAQRDRFEAGFGNGGKPVFLSMIHLLAAPQTAFQHNEVFPDAEVTLSRLSALVGSRDTRIVLTLDALHRFFLAAGTAALETRVRTTRWETLYEVSWSDLLEEVRVAFPEADIVVLTPLAAALQSDAILSWFFSESFLQNNDAYALARPSLSAEGRQELDAMVGEGAVSPDALEGLIAAHPLEASAADLRDRLGIDGVTADLMSQKFAEDLDTIDAMPGVQVL